MVMIHKLVFLALMSPILLSAQTYSRSDPQIELKKLASLLKQGVVKEVRVLHLRDSTLTRVDVSKKELGSIASYNLDFDDQVAEKFAPLFKGTSAKKEDHPPDLRWGVYFYDARGQGIGSLFVDKFGQYGYLNDQNVLFKTVTSEGNLAVCLHKIAGIKD